MLSSENMELFKEALFQLSTRRFGKVTEILIKRLIKLDKNLNKYHDLYNSKNKERVEVKFSVVRKNYDFPIQENAIIESIMSKLAINRRVKFENWKLTKFDCNIQQIKKSEFEILYYGLFFSECILIFKIPSEKIDHKIYYSNKQHKGNVGEGQFHLNQNTLQIHLDNYFYKILTYEDLYNILKRNGHAPENTVTSLSAAPDTPGKKSSAHGSVHGAWPGEDCDGSHHYQGELFEEDLGDSAQASGGVGVAPRVPKVEPPARPPSGACDGDAREAFERAFEQLRDLRDQRGERPLAGGTLARWAVRQFNNRRVQPIQGPEHKTIQGNTEGSEKFSPSFYSNRHTDTSGSW